MKNKLPFSLICSITIIMVACGGSSERKPISGQQLAEYQETIAKVQKVEDLLCEINGVKMDATDALQLSQLADQLCYTYDANSLDSLSIVKCQALQQRVEDLQQQIHQTIKQNIHNIYVPIVNDDDCLLEKKTTYPVYLKRGEKLHVNITTKRAATLKVYNYDSHSTLKTISGKTSFKFTLDIENTAIYLVEINPGNSLQYASIHIAYTANQVDRLTPVTINERTVEAKSGDFRAWSVKGIKMTPILDEPRKFTLRGQLKAMFSGSYRGLVAIEVPAGATDILYSMRISTNEADRRTDGEFNNNMNASYRKIKSFGLPIYESTRSSGILNTILGEYTPKREEDAYINMFVFSSSSQAKKFQDGIATTKLSYDVNSSIMGMQSSNGRIPVKGRKTIYLGFENERTRYNNYVWVEVLASKPINEYFKSEYYIN